MTKRGEMKRKKKRDGGRDEERGAMESKIGEK